MKKCLTMLLALALVLSFGCNAFAQAYYTLPEVRAQAAQGWHETYTDKYGREIKVDIGVDVQGEDKLPVLRASVAQHTLSGDVAAAYTRWSDGNRIVIECNNPAEDVFKSVRGEKGVIVHYAFGEKLDMDKAYGAEYGAAITMQEVADRAAEELAKHGVDAANFLYAQPKEFTVRCRVNRDTLQMADPAAYFVHFWQTMRGLPVVAHVNDAYEKQSWPSYWPQMVVTMRDADSYSICVDALEEAETLAEDIPLCSFETVKEQVASQIEAGHICKVMDMRLGYVVFNDPNLPKNIKTASDVPNYYLVPMWIVECVYMDNPKKEYALRSPESDELVASEYTALGHRTLLLNAQTGEALDYEDRSQSGYGDSAYQGFIPWDDVK